MNEPDVKIKSNLAWWRRIEESFFFLGNIKLKIINKVLFDFFFAALSLWKCKNFNNFSSIFSLQWFVFNLFKNLETRIEIFSFYFFDWFLFKLFFFFVFETFNWKSWKHSRMNERNWNASGEFWLFLFALQLRILIS